MFGTRFCAKHINDGSLNSAALQCIREKEKICYLSVDEFMNSFAAVKNEYLLRVSTVEKFSKAPSLNFDDLADLTSKTYYILTGLSRSDFDNLSSRIPSPALRNTQNRSAKTAVACLLMKLQLKISHQVLAALFLIKDKRTVFRIFHS